MGLLSTGSAKGSTHARNSRPSAALFQCLTDDVKIVEAVFRSLRRSVCPAVHQSCSGRNDPDGGQHDQNLPSARRPHCRDEGGAASLPFQSELKRCLLPVLEDGLPASDYRRDAHAMSSGLLKVSQAAIRLELQVA